MILENYTPEPIDETVVRSRDFFDAAFKKSKTEVERAETRLDDAYHKYDDDTFDGGTVIREAEEHLANCEVAHEFNERRVEWEATRQFAKEVKPDRPMLTPWKDSVIEWLAIFFQFRRPNAP